MKKFKLKDLKKLSKYIGDYSGNLYYEELKGELKLIKQWSKNGIEKCKVSVVSGYEFIFETEDLQEIKTKSNKKTKK
jgi:hypothetical protein